MNPLNLLSLAYDSLVAGKEKAVAGAIVAFAVALLAQHLGVHAGDGIQQLLNSLLVAVLTHLSVYFTRNTE